MSANIGFIAVHGGAGTHAFAYEKSVKKALREACQRALSVDSVGALSLSMTEEAISSLEDNPYLNAGYGSNLTLAGTVECDASIMSGHSGHFGAIGAVSGIKNPIRLARSVLEYSQIPDKLERIPPLVLVSDGAREFARSFPETVKCVPPLSLVTPQAEEQWNKWKRRLESSSDDAPDLHAMQDTVGAVAWHAQDGMSSGVSSGGLLLKYPGRVGEAAIFGTGCWAQQIIKDSTKYEIGCSISGAGEYIVRSMLARAIGDAFEMALTRGEEVDPHEILRSVLMNKFIEPCRRRGESDPAAGVLLLTTEQDDSGHTARLWCVFTTPSMAIAYASTEDPKPQATILRRPASKVGMSSDIFITAISL